MLPVDENVIERSGAGAGGNCSGNSADGAWAGTGAVGIGAGESGKRGVLRGAIWRRKVQDGVF